MCQLLVGLPTVTVLGVVDLLPSVPSVVHVEVTLDAVERCAGCDTAAMLKDRDAVTRRDWSKLARVTP